MDAKTGVGRATAYKKRGILVFRVGALKASVVDATIEKVRKEREQEVLGRVKLPEKKARAAPTRRR
jgi:hypothetical protein